MKPPGLLSCWTLASIGVQVIFQSENIIIALFVYLRQLKAHAHAHSHSTLFWRRFQMLHSPMTQMCRD